MLVFFADDARQTQPSRSGVGRIVAAGAICVREEELRILDLQLSKICSEFGFPDDEEFKWSPSRDAWMWSNLKDERRREFYARVLEVARQRGVSAVVVIADISKIDPATGRVTTEEDVTKLLLEAIHLQIPIGDCGMVVADRPGGGRDQEDNFIAQCLEAQKSGTAHVRNFELISLILTANSKMVRLLQLADLITSCTTAMVAGSPIFAAAIFEYVRPLLLADQGRTGGIGLKIYPPESFANLYHWIVGDVDYVHHNTTYRLPMPGYSYPRDATTP